ncbi:hypothetical protein B7486_46885 [cyanobacterium TDX16]|nr:hypothetical protein B7486_46885 [cyanobacterium TDX16]
MRIIDECNRCKFHANSEYLVCANHPQGIESDRHSCLDFEAVADEFSFRQSNYTLEDLEIAENILERQGYSSDSQLFRELSTLIAEALYDPIEDLLTKNLSDRFYYTLRLSQLCKNLILSTPLELPDEKYSTLKADVDSILVHQAKFLAAYGSTEILSYNERQLRYGDDYYIAVIITQILSRERELETQTERAVFNELLERISDSAHLHGYDAIGRVRGSSLRSDYNRHIEFDFHNFDRAVWEERDNYLPVPFSAKRTIAFVEQRFDIKLQYPFSPQQSHLQQENREEQQYYIELERNLQHAIETKKVEIEAIKQKHTTLLKEQISFSIRAFLFFCLCGLSIIFVKNSSFWIASIVICAGIVLSGQELLQTRYHLKRQQKEKLTAR